MKPNGFVLAASTTSQTSMSILSHISASSLTRPMLTARNVFSSSLTISATRVELTGTIVSIADAVERAGELRAVRRQAADHLRHVVRLEVRVARIDALGREREEEVDAGLEPGRFEHRLHDFVGRAGIGRRLEHDEHARVQVLRDRLDGRDDVGHVRVLRLAQRRRHADVDGVELLDDREVGRRVELAGLACSACTSAVGTSGM